MRREGAWSDHYVPAFPTLTFTNGHTISTGCWPANHGVVSNRFIDPERGLFHFDRGPGWNTNCEHLHEVANQHGVRANTLGWGAARHQPPAAPKGLLAGIPMPDPTDPLRAEQVAGLLKLPETLRPRMVLAFFRGPDAQQHLYGLESERTREAVVAADEAVGKILATVESLPFQDEITVLVVTDHGMREVSTLINIQQIVDNHEIPAKAISSGSTSFLYFEDPSQIDRAYEILSEYTQFDVFYKAQQPPYSRLGTGPRVGDLIVSAHPPYFIEDPASWPPWIQRLDDFAGSMVPEFIWARFAVRATHGFPPWAKGMQGTVFAWGKGIAKGRKIGTVHAIDIHPTVTHLLGIDPGKPVDGTVATGLLE